MHFFRQFSLISVGTRPLSKKMAGALVLAGIYIMKNVYQPPIRKIGKTKFAAELDLP